MLYTTGAVGPSRKGPSRPSSDRFFLQQTDRPHKALKVDGCQTGIVYRHGLEVIRSSDRFISKFFRKGLFMSAYRVRVAELCLLITELAGDCSSCIATMAADGPQLATFQPSTPQPSTLILVHCHQLLQLLFKPHLLHCHFPSILHTTSAHFYPSQ
ncbi:hypothetical protein CROQUDRAFT_94952 [Cronartium quercuum f. sp. fusiforme G11]|uniref:Uncharacterized protein n=1 Tax=Cronartium quercuum f. sp. fusiforme G11 TaxID=708437 RepID=A0A9P6ND21_9BASI|nr:hypothetical protein CROQUDRAFT_94952 [Cronartium quercuum f. sp. fusiforme G11]